MPMVRFHAPERSACDLHPGMSPAQQVLTDAQQSVSMLTCTSPRACAGAALLAVQPGMAHASAGEVAAVLSRGVVMHKAWIHDTGNPTAGSTR